jgi:hypothetical protein
VIAHEGNQAFYDMSIENGELVMAAKLEIRDIKKTLKLEHTCEEGQDFNFCAGNWLMNQISISIDGKTRSLKLEEGYTEDGHLFLKFGLGKPPFENSTIQLLNIAFVNQFPDYENIIQTTLYDNKQGYKMDKERTTITIKLNDI